MSLPVLVLRPEPGGAATLAGARALGLAAEAHPLFAIGPLAWTPVAPNAIDGLLLGSVNALRHAGPTLDVYRGLPAYVVGETTAAAARMAGLTVILIGTGGLQSVLNALPRRPGGPLHLLRLAGRTRTPLTVPSHIILTTREVYAGEPLPMAPALAARLTRPTLALLHSGEAAARFATLCDAAGIERAHIALAALAPRIAARAGAGWASIRCAATPDDATLLALAVEMCQDLAVTFNPPR